SLGADPCRPESAAEFDVPAASRPRRRLRVHLRRALRRRRAPGGAQPRLAFPLTWGGTKQAAAELDKSFTRGPLSRVLAGGSVSRRTNPFYEEDDDRARVWVRRAPGTARAAR